MKHIIIASVLSLSALTAHAADNGAYVFGNLGYNASKMKMFGDTEGAQLQNNKAGGASWEIGAGYRISPYLATELSYADFGKMQGDIATPLGTLTPSIALRAERVAVLGILPVADNLEVFGKLSLNNVHANAKLQGPAGAISEKKSNVKAGVGFGASYAVNKNLSVRGEYEYIAARYQAGDDAGLKTNGINLFKAGLSYQF
ncbi:outer membrane beta-barrel protein [Chromobacterium vaccinii]|uniref:Outer membrane beta-barrel protein n=1 Tax=Chromobacterium vaccinii TaxID=1108595 RepID=A0ABV0FCZ2_9NEIS